MKSGGAHVSTSCYFNPGLLYTMHTLRFNMILLHDQQNPLTTSNCIVLKTSVINKLYLLLQPNPAMKRPMMAPRSMAGLPPMKRARMPHINNVGARMPLNNSNYGVQLNTAAVQQPQPPAYSTVGMLSSSNQTKNVLIVSANIFGLEFLSFHNTCF